MKAWRVLLFMAAVIALLAGVCYVFPQGRASIGSLKLKFPTLSKVLNPQHELDVEAYLREQDSLAALLDSLQDSTESYRQQLDSSDIRFWFPNDDAFCSVGADVHNGPHHPHSPLWRLAD